MSRSRSSFALAVSILLAGCAAAGGIDGLNSLVNVASEPAGSACEFGGVKIESGQDANRDGRLDVGEVDRTEYVCNGAEQAYATLTRADAEPAGSNCEFGGIRIDLGTDLDGNGALGDQEVTDTEYVCHGADGEDGAPGADGADGRDGVDGEDGRDGIDGEDGRDGVDGQDGQDGTSTGKRTIVLSHYVEDSAISRNNNDVTVLSLTINVPATGTVLALGSTHAFCYTSVGDPALPSCASGTTIGYARIVRSTADATNNGPGHSLFHLDKDVTSNVAVSNRFENVTAGSHTFYFRGLAQTGEIGFWRTNLNLVYVEN